MTIESVVAELRALGLTEGSRVVVHASLRSLGPVEEGALGVVRALCEVVGERGLVLIPSFNHGVPFVRGSVGLFDPRSTKSENGALSDTFWRQPGVHRSLHPTHAFAAWGDGAKEIVEGHDLTLTMGPDSPLGRLHRQGGFLLHLGTSHEVSTAKHLAETLAHASCLGYAGDEFAVLLPGGELVKRSPWRYRARPCPLTDEGGHIERRLEERGVERTAPVGYAVGRLSPLVDFVREVIELLREGAPGITPCRACTILPGRAEGDWDC